MSEMTVKLRNGEELVVEVEYDGYKPLDIVDAEGRSLLSDYDLTEDEIDAIYLQACREWMENAIDAAEGSR